MNELVGERYETFTRRAGIDQLLNIDLSIVFRNEITEIRK